MTIWNLGSINVDFVYAVPHLPQPGETLSSTGREVFLGGKGTNMSVAISRAGGQVNHIGAIGADGQWTVERLADYGVDTTFVATIDSDTAQAIIAVDSKGENLIILHPGANRAIPADLLERALTQAKAGDWFVTQNETSLQVEGVALAKKRGLKVAYAAAPFEAKAVMDVLPHLDFMILNAVEMEQLTQATGLDANALGVDMVIVTKGAEGADLYRADGARSGFPAIPVQPVDTTGAGDTFTGYVLSALDRGLPVEQAITLATKAGALMVMRHGTADVIPNLDEVEAFQP